MRPSASCSSIASRSPQPSSSMSLVIAARPGRPAGSADAPIGSSARKLTSGTARCSTVQTRRPFGQRASLDLREAERRIGAERGKPRAIDRHHDTETGLGTGKRQRDSVLSARR